MITHPLDLDDALVRAGRFRPLAERALADEPPSRAEALALLASGDDELPALLWAAFAVRATHFGRRVKLCVLQIAG